jgi:hypothetical protein
MLGQGHNTPGRDLLADPPMKSTEAHRSGKFYIHGLEVLLAHCVRLHLARLLPDGFRGVEGKVEGPQPKDSGPLRVRSTAVNSVYTMDGQEGEENPTGAISNDPS